MRFGVAVNVRSRSSRIREVMDSLARRIEHVGSTSVPGLAAKPVIGIANMAVPEPA